jgi:hypothetical protein
VEGWKGGKVEEWKSGTICKFSFSNFQTSLPGFGHCADLALPKRLREGDVGRLSHFQIFKFSNFQINISSNQ